MRKKSTLIGCTLATLLTMAFPMAAHRTEATEATDVQVEKVRVGTFNTRGVALAYGRSARPDCMLAKVKALKAEHAQARKEGKEPRVKELEAKGKALQAQIHKQVFSTAPIDDILKLLEQDLPQVAKAARVKLIVSGVLHRAPDVEVVDITQEMCAPFKPDEKTKKMIEQVLVTPPVDESELSHDR